MERHYECMIIMSASLSEEKRGDLITKFSKMASPKTTVEKWGLRKFAYPINYKNEGFYVLFHFTADEKKVAEMTALMNITDGIIRFVFVKKDEKMLAADAERRAARKAAKDAKEAREAKAAPATEEVAG